MIKLLLHRLRYVPYMVMTALAVSTGAYRYLYHEALTDVGRVRAEAQRDAAIEANRRNREVATRISAAMEERERVLQQRIRDLETLMAHADAQRELAERVLRDYETAQKADNTPAYQEWKDQPVPESVAERLRGLADEN